MVLRLTKRSGVCFKGRRLNPSPYMPCRATISGMYTSPSFSPPISSRHWWSGLDLTRWSHVVGSRWFLLKEIRRFVIFLKALLYKLESSRYYFNNNIFVYQRFFLNIKVLYLYLIPRPWFTSFYQICEVNDGIYDDG